MSGSDELQGPMFEPPDYHVRSHRPTSSRRILRHSIQGPPIAQRAYIALSFAAAPVHTALAPSCHLFA